MAIYTRTGDTGTTALFGGKRVLKCEELVDVYGSIDELNSWVGLVSSQITVPDVQEFLGNIQSDLFTVGSALAGANVSLHELDRRVEEIEARIDLLEKELPEIRNFILPGGSQLGALIHVARSICRRVERQTVSLATQAERAKQERQVKQARQEARVNNALQEKDMNMIIQYLNRLSDLFFMLARFINKEKGVVEIVWKGQHKK